jgi:two-component system, NarL family, nitrate/nitrite response regulator NarL
MGIRILLVDDHTLFRDAFCALLATQPDIEVVGQAGNARDALALVDTQAPDVVVLDVNLPGISGLSLARELTRRTPPMRVLVLTMYKTEDIALQAASAGALGFARKDERADVVLQAMRSVASGQNTFDSGGLGARQGRPVRPGGLLEALSRREREVFDLIVQGYSNQNIAKELFISIKTVETHRASINRKLGVHSTGDLVRFAAARGLVVESC